MSGKGNDPDHRAGHGRIRQALADLSARWFASTDPAAADDEPEVADAHASFAVTVHRWFLRQTDRVKELIITTKAVVVGPDRRAETTRLKRYKADPNAPVHELVAQLVEALAERYGAPAVEEVKVIGWRVGPGVDVIVQKDQNWGAYVWLAWPLDGFKPNYLMEIYEAGRGRHSGSYLLPALAEGNAALKVKVASKWHVRIVTKVLDVARAERVSR